MKIRFGLVIVAALLVFSCDKKQEENKGGMYESANGSESSNNTSTPKEDQKPPAVTSVEFMESEFNFGTINEGAVASHSFKLKNTGSHPLIISSATADCGCTVPNPPKEPIMPGHESQIDVKFNSTNKGGDINKTITVVANTDPSISRLHMKGRVIRKDEGSPIKK